MIRNGDHTLALVHASAWHISWSRPRCHAPQSALLRIDDPADAEARFAELVADLQLAREHAAQ
ncbi:MAG TPA: hypothetical protein VG755_05955 [Nannocystaceae bacterium]|nr:hypothetical protein [Nannocystaceae bacterium]